MNPASWVWWQWILAVLAYLLGGGLTLFLGSLLFGEPGDSKNPEDIPDGILLLIWPALLVIGGIIALVTAFGVLGAAFMHGPSRLKSLHKWWKERRGKKKKKRRKGKMTLEEWGQILDDLEELLKDPFGGDNKLQFQPQMRWKDPLKKR